MGRPKGTVGEAIPMTDQELTCLIESVTNTKRNKQRNLMLIRMLARLGQSLGYLASLKVSDVFQEGKLCHPDHFKSLGIDRYLLKYISKSKLNSDDPLFPSQKGNHLSGKTVGLLIKRLLNKAGLNHLSAKSIVKHALHNLAYLESQRVFVTQEPKPNNGQPVVYWVINPASKYELVKIGYTIDISSRLKQLKRDAGGQRKFINPMLLFCETTQQAREIEKTLHKEYSDSRFFDEEKETEWFDQSVITPSAAYCRANYPNLKLAVGEEEINTILKQREQTESSSHDSLRLDSKTLKRIRQRLGREHSQYPQVDVTMIDDEYVSETNSLVYSWLFKSNQLMKELDGNSFLLLCHFVEWVYLENKFFEDNKLLRGTTMDHLADSLGLTKPTIRSSISTLVDSGYIQRYCYGKRLFFVLTCKLLDI